MDAPDVNVVSAWVLAIVMGLAAAFERIRNAKQAKKREENAELISDAKKEAERAEMHSRRADEYKQLFEKEHVEFQNYRTYVHDKQQKDQAALLNAQERIAELQARPDFSDLFEHLKTQSDNTVQLVAGMKEVLTSIKSW